MIIEYKDLPVSIQAIFPKSIQKYPDFRCYVRQCKGEDRIFVKFNGETTRFIYKDKKWTADKTW